MDSETRPHRSSSGSDLFICFTSRFSSSSSSSMKISSKSILSPGRTDKFRDPQQQGPMSLSSSLSRRLRSNGSIKGGQASPMFPTGTKKRGSGFENPEPSSPKVTCIGQVRVKTKKKHHQQQRKLRPTRSQRRGSGGEVSFRRFEQQHQQQLQGSEGGVLGNNQNQKWVHLPLAICEALRTFGAEFNCFLPCRSSCARETGEPKEAASSREEGGSSCGAAFARWVLALQEGENENKGREIELVVGGEEEVEDEDMMEDEASWRRRRGGFAEIDIGDFEKDDSLEGGEGRASVCVPPKNALLLMRCRSDPVKMSALANRMWEPSVSKEDEDNEEEQQDDDGEESEYEEMEEKEKGWDVEAQKKEEEAAELKMEKLHDEEQVCEEWVSGEDDSEGNNEHTAEEASFESTEENNEKEQSPEMKVEIGALEESNAVMEKEQDRAEDNLEGEDEELDSAGVSASEECTPADPEILDTQEDEAMHIHREVEEEKEEIDEQLEITGSENQYPDATISVEYQEEEEEEEEMVQNLQESTQEGAAENETEVEAIIMALSSETEETEEKETIETASALETQDTGSSNHRSDPEQEPQTTGGCGDEGGVLKTSEKKDQTCYGGGALADSLLLQMMCEPKLSMEVSKETWVCSTDFIRRQRRPPPPPVNPADGAEEPIKKRNSIGTRPSHLPPPLPPQQLQPGRSSCTLPAAEAASARASVSMATMIGEKLVNAVAYEPFVLTRCKSEPMRSASKVAPPDACFWKNRKLEGLHRHATRVGVGGAGVGF